MDKLAPWGTTPSRSEKQASELEQEERSAPDDAFFELRELSAADDFEPDDEPEGDSDELDQDEPEKTARAPSVRAFQGWGYVPAAGDVAFKSIMSMLDSGVPAKRFEGAEMPTSRTAPAFSMKFADSGLGLTATKTDNGNLRIEFDAPAGLEKGPRGALVKALRGKDGAVAHGRFAIEAQDLVHARRVMSYAMENVIGLNEVHKVAQRGLIDQALLAHKMTPGANPKLFTRMPVTGLSGDVAEVVSLEPGRGIELVGKVLARDDKHAVLALGQGASRVLGVVSLEDVPGLAKALSGDFVRVLTPEGKDGRFGQPEVRKILEERAIELTAIAAMRAFSTRLEADHEAHLAHSQKTGTAPQEYGEFIRSSLAGEGRHGARKGKIDEQFVQLMGGQLHLKCEAVGEGLHLKTLAAGKAVDKTAETERSR